MRNPTRVESGTRHQLAWCRECPSWRELRDTNFEALVACAVHVQLVHGRAKLAAQLRARAATDTPKMFG